MPPRFQFDERYYQRYYRDTRTQVSSSAEVEALGDFVCAYLRHLGQPVRRVLDLGCGLGHFQHSLARHYPRAHYTGVEVSEYLCQEYGWERGSVVDYRAKTPFDLVICQGVLQYLGHRDAARAVENLGRLCRGALYLEALTTEDWADACDRDRTDGDVYLRSARWYRRHLRTQFTSCGGGIFLHSLSPAVTFALERA